MKMISVSLPSRGMRPTAASMFPASLRAGMTTETVLCPRVFCKVEAGRLGDLHLSGGAAFSFYHVTLKYDENHRGALNNLGVMALDANRYDAAEMWLRRAESIDPHNAKTHFLLAKALLAKGNRQAAQLEIDTAIRLRPGQREFKQLRQQIETDSP
jgi:tetratricopeptide (TPR) repeat protein